MIIFTLYSLALEAQNIIEVKHENVEGVIFCKSFYSEEYLKSYNVFDLSPAQVKEFEKILQETSNTYPNFIRQYKGIRKDNKNYLVVSLISRNILEQGEDWRKEPIIIIDACEDMRYITYDLDLQKILYNRTATCDY